jgi:hypothetical protein
MPRHRKAVRFIHLGLALIAAALGATQARANEVLKWNATVVGVAAAGGQNAIRAR